MSALMVCARITAELLEYTRSHGNNVSTSAPEIGFPGLKPGDQWCLCASRWREVLEAGAVPHVVLAATHKRALEVSALADLKRHALGLT